MQAIPARVIATSFALTCFAGTLCFGLYNSNGWQSILINAALVGFFALLVGMLIGSVALRSVNEQIERHRADNPVPEEHQDPAGESELGQTAAG